LHLLAFAHSMSEDLVYGMRNIVSFSIVVQSWFVCLKTINVLISIRLCGNQLFAIDPARSSWGAIPSPTPFSNSRGYTHKKVLSSVAGKLQLTYLEYSRKCEAKFTLYDDRVEVWSEICYYVDYWCDTHSSSRQPNFGSILTYIF